MENKRIDRNSRLKNLVLAGVAMAPALIGSLNCASAEEREISINKVPSINVCSDKIRLSLNEGVIVMGYSCEDTDGLRRYWEFPCTIVKKSSEGIFFGLDSKLPIPFIPLRYGADDNRDGVVGPGETYLVIDPDELPDEESPPVEQYPAPTVPAETKPITNEEGGFEI